MTTQTIELIKEAEQAVLGACLQGGSGSVLDNPFAQVRDIISADDFLPVNHQLIFRAIESVYSEEKPICPISVAMQLDTDGDLKRVGGPDYLYELQAPIVETENATYYAAEVRDAALKRKYVGIGAKLQDLANSSEMTPAEIMAHVHKQLEGVDLSYSKIDSMTAKELYELDLPPVEWIVPGLIPDGLTVLAGDAKIGKSFFAWNIAIAVAMGGTALSNIDIEKSRNVTYFALEDPTALLQERLGMLTHDVIPSNIHIVDNKHNITFDSIGLKLLEEHINKTKSELVIVDTWKHVAPVINENGTSYDIDYKRLIPVQNFTHSKGISMLLVTHTRKANDIDNPFNQIQGSMGMQAGCDTMLMITRGTGGHSLHVTGRRVVQDEYAITLSQGGIWELEGRANDVRKTETRQVIIEMLTEAGDEGMRATDIITSSGRKENAVRLQLRRMLKDGEIIQPSVRGKYYHANGNNPVNDDEIKL